MSELKKVKLMDYDGSDEFQAQIISKIKEKLKDKVVFVDSFKDADSFLFCNISDKIKLLQEVGVAIYNNLKIYNYNYLAEKFYELDLKEKSSEYILEVLSDDFYISNELITCVS